MSQLRANVCYVKDKIDVLKLTNHNYVTTENMLPNKCGIVECLTMPLTGKVTKFVKQDILVSNIRPYFKKIWYADRDGGCSADVLVFRIIDREKYDSKFLYYVLMQDKFFDHMVGGSNGTKMPRGNKNITMDFEINDYDLPIQRKIAGILSAYDDLIENNRRQIKLLEEAARRLYKEWFVDLRFPSHEQTEMVDGLPAGWERKKLGEMGKIVTGKTPSTIDKDNYGGDIPFVKIPDMHGRIYPFETETYITAKGANKSCLIPKNSIMVSCIATVGLVSISVKQCQTNQQINSLILDEEEYLYYVYFVLKDMQRLLDGVGSNGATMTNVNKSKFSNLEIVIPCKELAMMYYTMSKSFFEKIYRSENVIRLLQEARDRLLPKLMSGEIEVE